MSVARAPMFIHGGEIEWRECDISDLCQFQRGFDLTEATRTPGTVPVYSSSGLSYFHDKAKIQPPVVITGRKGQLGKVFFVQEPCWPHDTTLWVKDFKGNDPRFVAIFLAAFKLERFDAATSVPTLNRNNLVGHPIRLPPLREQRAIATALSDVDALLDGMDRLISKKRDLKQAAMQQLLTGKTRLPGFHGDWEVKRLGDLIQLSRTGIVPSSNPAKLYTHFSLPAFDANQTPQVEAGGSIGSNKLVVPQGAVLLSKLNPRIPRVWAPCDVPPNSVCSTEFLVLLPSTTVERSFLKYICMSPYFSSQMELHAIGTTGSHQRIQPSQATAIEVRVPTDLHEQAAIANILSEMDMELAALEARREKTRALKQAMMQELLTGRTRLIKPEPVEPEAAYA